MEPFEVVWASEQDASWTTPTSRGVSETQEEILRNKMYLLNLEYFTGDFLRIYVQFQ